MMAGAGTPKNQPRPSSTKPLSRSMGIEKPSVISSATPRKIDRPASVTMKAGMP
jgi:hypothetical protein